MPELPDPRRQPFVTVPVAGQFLGIGRSPSYEAARRGDIPTIRVGHSLRVPTAWLWAVAQLDLDALGAPTEADAPSPRSHHMTEGDEGDRTAAA